MTTTPLDDREAAAVDDRDPVLEVRDLEVTFGARRGFRKAARPLRAVDRISFDIRPGETLGLVGESGSGKSTTARGVSRLVPVTGGSVRLGGVELTELEGKDLRAQRRNIQMVFQDPYSSLDPSTPVGESIAEPLRVHEGIGRRDAQGRVRELLERVGLSGNHAKRYPYEFSGGQRQRIAIARAIALNPKVVLCDEAVSALDVSTQNQVINLLEDLRTEFGIAYLFIAHDLTVVRHISHRVAVMYLGRIVERGPAARLFDDPKHPYTVALLSASPEPDPPLQRTRQRILLAGDPPDPRNPPSGCVFSTRCPEVMDICREVDPPPAALPGGGEVRCHLHPPAPGDPQPVTIGGSPTA